MKNSYEVAEIAELGNAKHLVLGIKWLSPFDADCALGQGFRFWFDDDIDESDE